MERQAVVNQNELEDLKQQLEEALKAKFDVEERVATIEAKSYAAKSELAEKPVRPQVVGIIYNESL